MTWALDGQVAGAGRRRWPGPTTPTRSPPCCASATTPRIPVTAAAGRSGVCGGVGPALRRRRARPVRPRPASCGRRHVAHRRRAAPARSATTSSTSCAPRTASRSATGRSRSTCRPSAAGWPAAAPVSSRPATARSRTWSSASTSCWPTADAHTPAARPPGRRARPQPAVRRHRGHARHHHRRPAPAAPGAGPRATRGVRLRDLRATGSTPAGASCAAAPRPPCCASTTRSSPNRSYQTGDLAVLLVLDEGDPALVDATMRAGRRGVRGRPAPRRRRWSSTGSATATTSSPLEQLISGGLVVDTMEITGPWAALPDIYAAGDRRDQAVPRHAGRVGPPVARLPRRRLPLLHLRRQARARPTKDAYYRAVWDAGTRAVLARGGVAQPPPRRRPQPGPVHARGARRRPRRARVDQGRRSTRTASSTPASSACPARSAPTRSPSRPGRRDRPGSRLAVAVDIGPGPERSTGRRSASVVVVALAIVVALRPRQDRSRRQLGRSALPRHPGRLRRRRGRRRRHVHATGYLTARRRRRR